MANFPVVNSDKENISSIVSPSVWQQYQNFIKNEKLDFIKNINTELQTTIASNTKQEENNSTAILNKINDIHLLLSSFILFITTKQSNSNDFKNGDELKIISEQLEEQNEIEKQQIVQEDTIYQKSAKNKIETDKVNVLKNINDNINKILYLNEKKKEEEENEGGEGGGGLLSGLIGGAIASIGQNLLSKIELLGGKIKDVLSFGVKRIAQNVGTIAPRIVKGIGIGSAGLMTGVIAYLTGNKIANDKLDKLVEEGKLSQEDRNKIDPTDSISMSSGLEQDFIDPNRTKTEPTEGEKNEKTNEGYIKRIKKAKKDNNTEEYNKALEEYKDFNNNFWTGTANSLSLNDLTKKEEANLSEEQQNDLNNKISELASMKLNVMSEKTNGKVKFDEETLNKYKEEIKKELEQKAIEKNKKGELQDTGDLQNVYSMIPEYIQTDLVQKGPKAVQNYFKQEEQQEKLKQISSNIIPNTQKEDNKKQTPTFNTNIVDDKDDIGQIEQQNDTEPTIIQQNNNTKEENGIGNIVSLLLKLSPLAAVPALFGTLINKRGMGGIASNTAKDMVSNKSNNIMGNILSSLMVLSPLAAVPALFGDLFKNDKKNSNLASEDTTNSFGSLETSLNPLTSIFSTLLGYTAEQKHNWFLGTVEEEKKQNVLTDIEKSQKDIIDVTRDIFYVISSIASKGFGINVDEELENYRNKYKNANGQSNTMPLTDDIGDLSAKYESKGNSDTIGWDSTGGTSYGKYQISSKAGTMKEFIEWVSKNGGEHGQEIATRLKKAGADVDTGSTNGLGPEEWKKIVAEGKMGNLEQEFIKATHYDRTFKGLDQNMQDRISKSKTLQKVLWSTSVALGAGGAKQAFNQAGLDYNNMSDEDLIKSIYKFRDTRYGNSTPEVRAAVLQRNASESADALALYQQEKNGGGTTAKWNGKGSLEPSVAPKRSNSKSLNQRVDTGNQTWDIFKQYEGAYYGAIHKNGGDQLERQDGKLYQDANGMWRNGLNEYDCSQFVALMRANKGDTSLIDNGWAKTSAGMMTHFAQQAKEGKARQVSAQDAKDGDIILFDGHASMVAKDDKGQLRVIESVGDNQKVNGKWINEASQGKQGTGVNSGALTVEEYPKRFQGRGKFQIWHNNADDNRNNLNPVNPQQSPTTVAQPSITTKEQDTRPGITLPSNPSLNQSNNNDKVNPSVYSKNSPGQSSSPVIINNAPNNSTVVAGNGGGGGDSSQPMVIPIGINNPAGKLNILGGALLGIGINLG